MATTFASRKTAIIALAATAVLGGGVAYAYPPGTDLTVAAAAAATSGGNADIMVTVSNANPSCQTLVQVEGAPSVLLPAGTTTHTFTVVASPGRHSVTARTVDCPKGQKEHAKSKYVILNAQASHAPTAQVKKNYQVDYSGLQPDDVITVTATLSGNLTQPQLTESDSVDRRGDAKVKFKFPKAGTWVITSTASPSGATVASFNVVVS
jgi:hypothetical protein